MMGMAGGMGMMGMGGGMGMMGMAGMAGMGMMGGMLGAGAGAGGTGGNNTPLGVAATPPTANICLENLVEVSVLSDDTEYGEVTEDVRDECANSGTVLKVIIPRAGENAGKAYVKFADATTAVCCVYVCQCVRVSCATGCGANCLLLIFSG
jgi:hypothetical protein